MMRSLFSAVSGLKSHQTAMDVIGNNIANVNTTGFKSSRTLFQDIYSQTISAATAPTDTTGGVNAKQVGLGTQIASIDMNMTEGTTQTTSYPLDFSISGEGFFVIDNGDGTYSYTRNGAFQLDANGYLVTANGDYVMAVSVPEDENGDPDYSAIDNGASVIDVDTDTNTRTPKFGRIRLQGEVDVPEDIDGDDETILSIRYSEYAVDKYGVITATKTVAIEKPVTDEDGDPLLDGEGNPITTVVNETSVVQVGRLVLATFDNSAGLEKIGQSYYKESANSGAARYDFAGYNCGSLNPGSLEMSNVDLASELTNMIIMQRGFQANSRVITTSDTMLEELINLKR
ncbi:MAG TPA: flagellar hook-basal body complex protein [Clostridiales bacterium]|nr:flagellar hook-basal body complex protein [Clostridiales bacterium]